MTDNEEKINENKTLRVNGNVLFVGAIFLVVITVFATFFIADRIYYNGALFRKSESVTFSGEGLDEYKVSKFQDLLRFIEENYYLEYDINDILEGAISGAVEALEDPYSMYLEPGKLDEYVDYITGTYVGAGISYQKSEKGLLIGSVEAESSADKAGIVAGDIISEIEGKPVGSYTDDELDAVFAKEGSKIKLKVIKASEEIQEVTVTISKVGKQSVFVNDYDGVMYIKITQFDEDTGKEFLTAMEKIEKIEHKGIILDLRNNGGGYEKQANIVADRILPEGLIAYSENKKGERITETKSDATCIDSPLVVLINGKTASASELVAGAIRDHKKGTLIGEKTYGKALGQTKLEYPEDGSGVVLTIAKFFTPSGECIHGKGISPNIEISLEENSNEDAQLEKAFEVLSEKSN